MLYTLVAAPVWTVASVRLAVDGSLLAIIVVSLALGRPFSLQYARERLPKEYWTSLVFVAANRLITSVWAGAFAVLVAADAAAEYLPLVPLWVVVIASILAVLGAFGFTLCYPAKLRRSAARLGPR